MIASNEISSNKEKNLKHDLNTKLPKFIQNFHYFQSY